MGWLENIERVHRVLASVKGIHESGKYIHENIIKKNMANSAGCTTCPKAQTPIAISCPATAQEYAWVTIKGMSQPGLIQLYSGTELIKEIYPGKNGLWATNLKFTATGLFEIIAKLADGSGSASCKITVS